MELFEIVLRIRAAKNSSDTLFDLAYSRISSLPSEIKDLKNITRLNVSNNKLTTLPREIRELKKLTKLNISYNQFVNLPPIIFELKSLTQLDVSGNQLSSLPSEILNLKNLTKLNISNNHRITLSSDIFELNNLNELDVSNSRLTSLPSEIYKLKNLTYLNISNNQLTSLPSEIFELKSLTYLNISNNQLTSLPPEIAELKTLTHLNISNNQLTSLPAEILDLGLKFDLETKEDYRYKTNSVFLSGNFFEYPPLGILRLGREATLNYFNSIEGERKPISELKILLVGDGGSGKTSLVKRMFGEEIDGCEPQTQGIHISKMPIQYEDIEIKANFWDFGGQEIMHATHQFFFSERSFYILVIDGRKDEKADYWLKLIENFGGNSPIIIVINKIDEYPAFELNRKFLREKYPLITGEGFFRVSCKYNDGIEKFLNALKEEIKKVEHVEVKWPKNWFEVKNYLEKMHPNYADTSKKISTGQCINFIRYSEYKQICEKNGIINESTQNTLVNYLHDLGIVLHFKDIQLLSTFVLEPEWVTTAVYKIINSNEVAESKGVLKNEMLPEILKPKDIGDFHYPLDQYEFITNLMKRFELAYALDDHTMLLPSLLEIQEPDFDFVLENPLKFVIDYDFLPPSVMPLLIVKMNLDIRGNLRWRTGVVLENKEFKTIAVIKADVEIKRIYIDVDGKQKRDYFSVILFNLREINQSFEKIKAVEKIPLKNEPGIAVRYDHLTYLEEIGVGEWRPEGSRKEYNVKTLLGTVSIKRKEEELLEEISYILKTNDEEEKLDEMVRIFRELADESDDQKTLFEKLNNIIKLKPSINELKFDFNKAIKLYFEREKKY